MQMRQKVERQPSQLGQVLDTGDDGEEVVASQLAGLAREVRAPVWDQDFCLADSARVQKDLAGTGIARRVLEWHADLEIAQRNPG
jgi:hypothetical protein